MPFCAVSQVKQGTLTYVVIMGLLYKVNNVTERISISHLLLNLTAHADLFLGYMYFISFMEKGIKHEVTCTKISGCHQAREKL